MADRLDPAGLLKGLAYRLPVVRDLVEKHRAVVRERDSLRRLVHTKQLALRAGAFRPKAEPGPLAPEEQELARRFHELYYRRWELGEDTINLGWFGHRTLKCPFDLWTYQELIAERRPDVIVETGTRFGGSALFLASICQLLGHGRVITVDIDDSIPRPEHPLITYVTGSSVAPEIVSEVRRSIMDGERAFVILDSDHREAHVAKELELYAELVKPGDYLVVEDTNVNGHPAYPSFGPGPMEALEHFLSTHSEFAPDPRCERFMLTLNPRGFLRRAD